MSNPSSLSQEERLAFLSKRHIGDKDIVKNVAICGGTHGNELNGVHLTEYFQRSRGKLFRKSFDVHPVLVNKEAIAACRRYIDQDINRVFTLDNLTVSVDADEEGGGSAEDDDDITYELRRARQLDKELGPKASPTPRMDFVLDLHNTTANMHTTLIFAPGDAFAFEVAAAMSLLEPTIKTVTWPKDEEPCFLPTVARSGMTVEVGPVPHGTLKADLLLDTKRLLLHALDYIELRNNLLSEKEALKRARQQSCTLEVYERIGTVPFPRDSLGEIRGAIHPDLDEKDFCALKNGMNAFEMFDDTTRHFHIGDIQATGQDESIKPSPGEKEAAEPSSMPPTDPDDAGMMTADTRNDLYALFVNEAAYYEKDVAFWVATMRQKSISVYVTGEE
ncbi:unnamed protein product [Vitrella brassicaformis CCMP3155]|uniref:Aspartoacylase n=1 Tax=Vitrella brassicaformis (strain CCMP3155) TaxID=1169540 RepID=A0A0G4GEA8_VITBC|nr:unnamed protein product [Vitrella brassicaformis CCMP3155]|mmetsp:Transcript_38344/g.96059  ORF Transcript_38344/g.96059 Transcript_38344/m.96059 type:complete len:390 (-) Transcript_38344:261-1430(-)|eukprot:CEM27435.1 unnamed protein product [Vitrella brassicaformis CCMP3155]